MTEQQIKNIVELHINEFIAGIPVHGDAVSAYHYKNIIVTMLRKAILAHLIGCVSGADSYGAKKRIEAETWFNALYYATSYFRRYNDQHIYIDCLKGKANQLWVSLCKMLRSLDEEFNPDLTMLVTLENMEDEQC